MDGNVYAAGYSYYSGGGPYESFTVVSLCPAGTERWMYRHDSLAPGPDGATLLAVGPDSSILAAGYSVTPETGGDFLVVSLSPDGARRWVYRYNGPGNGEDEPRAITVDSVGNIYLAGYSLGHGSAPDFTVLSLCPAGTERWVYRYSGPGDGRDEAVSLAVAPDGNVYACGYSEGVRTLSDLTVIGLSPEGTERWVYRYDGPANHLDQLYSLALGPDGNVYVAGHSLVAVGTENRFVVISLSPEGTERWFYYYDNPEKGWQDRASALMVSPDGDVYAAGITNDTALGPRITVISLNHRGAERWVYRYGIGSQSRAYSLGVGPDGNIYTAGAAPGIAGGWQCFTVISLEPGTGIAEHTPAGFRAAPGPTIVRGNLNLQSALLTPHASIFLLDATGRRVMELQPGENDVRHLAPGVYFFRAEGARGQGTQGLSRKVIIQR